MADKSELSLYFLNFTQSVCVGVLGVVPSGINVTMEILVFAEKVNVHDFPAVSISEGISTVFSGLLHNSVDKNVKLSLY